MDYSRVEKCFALFEDSAIYAQMIFASGISNSFFPEATFSCPEGVIGSQISRILQKTVQNWIALSYTKRTRHSYMRDGTGMIQFITYFNPLLHLQKYKLAPKTFGFRHQGNPSGSPRTPQRNSNTNSLGTPATRGPPDAENRRFSELIERTYGVTK